MSQRVCLRPRLRAAFSPLPALALLVLTSLLGSPARTTPAQAQSTCTFTLGFALLRQLAGPPVVGSCLENERFDLATGNAEQHTDRGLLVWRKADNWTAFTDGFRTWVNGPFGLQQRLNTERFPWEADDRAAILLAAGDIADCTQQPPGAGLTARLLDSLPGTIAALGDTAYESGTPEEFRACYDRIWGRFKDRTRPAVGNHEYYTFEAAGYFGYFGAAAGDPTTGYYSYDLGSWHVVVLNTNCFELSNAGGCGAGSAQERWLRADLAAHPTRCALAYAHHPYFSSGEHGNLPELRPLWQALYDAGVELYLAGHDHNYERFAPQDPGGRADPPRGIRAIVTGTGGGTLRAPVTPVPNSAIRFTALGILQLTLRAADYDWQFIPVPAVPGQVAPPTDSGTGACH